MWMQDVMDWAVMVLRINTRADRVLKAMVPHTITPAVGAVCREYNYSRKFQDRFKLVVGPRCRSTGLLGSGGSKYITRKSVEVQLIRGPERPPKAHNG
ncbi:hypothetical protein TNCV_3640941 [Trichonephila clavipes]|nr:hypothetical protein TNCV_3640941 [Trichonephila clavipes]